MKKRLSITLAVFFLLQTIPTASGIEIPASPLNPPSKVAANSPDVCFSKICEIVSNALFLYKLDAVKQYHKEDIIKKYGPAFSGLIKVRFDLENMDIGKKGWTRYYPFSIGEHSFIIRIFLTGERAYQPGVEVLFEGAVENPAVTFQILPGVNSILKDCEIKPCTFYSDREVSGSS